MSESENFKLKVENATLRQQIERLQRLIAAITAERDFFYHKMDEYMTVLVRRQHHREETDEERWARERDEIGY